MKLEGYSGAMCDGQTDRQTDRQTQGHGLYSGCIASRGKNDSDFLCLERR